MGYVIDSNVKAVVSFYISPESFNSEADYNFAAKAIASKNANFNFDGNRRSFIIKNNNNGKSVETLSLDKASLRRVIKAGKKTDNTGVGVKLEKEYSQSHNYLEEMRSQVKGLFQGLRDSLCLLYTSPSPRDATLSRMPSSA